MEDFFVVGYCIVLLIVAIITLVSSAQKQKQKTASSGQGMSSARPPQPAQVPKPQAAPASMASMLPSRNAGTLQPTVHTHLQPDCDKHDAAGSLNFRSSEGKDPCHESQLPQTRQELPEMVQTAPPGISLEWTGESMVKAFVMQEVLTRPCQRRTR